PTLGGVLSAVPVGRCVNSHGRDKISTTTCPAIQTANLRQSRRSSSATSIGTFSHATSGTARVCTYSAISSTSSIHIQMRPDCALLRTTSELGGLILAELYRTSPFPPLAWGKGVGG